MIDLIHSLLTSSGFISTEAGDYRLYSYEEAEKRTVFWLVVNENDLALLINRQDEIFDICKESCQNSALDKNISMLVLWDTGGNQEISNMKRSILSVEEDPYYFKKNVLYYSPTELMLLKDKVGDCDFYDFLKEQIVSPETFVTYKKNPISQTWQSLIYRIAIKLPFVQIEIEEESEGLESLFEFNATEVHKRGLSDFDNSISKIIDSISDSSQLEPKDWLEKLTPALGGIANGD